MNSQCDTQVMQHLLGTTADQSKKSLPCARLLMCVKSRLQETAMYKIIIMILSERPCYVNNYIVQDNIVISVVRLLSSVYAH